MRPRRTTAALVGVATFTLLAGACGTDADPASAPATSRGGGGDKASPGADPAEPDEPADTSPPAEVDDGPPFPDSTDVQVEQPAGEWDLVISDVRVGSHDGFDRIVVDLVGTGTPGWSVQYVDEATEDASGEVVDLAGDNVLDVYAAGTTYPAEGGGDGYSGPRQFQPTGGGRVVDVYVVGTFEGYTQVLVGLSGDRTPFRVFPLADPPRLVVDVAR